MLSRKSVARLSRLLPIFVMGAFTFLILPNSGCGKGIFPEVTGSATTTATGTSIGTPSSTPSPGPAVQPFSMIGSGTAVSLNDGTCTGGGCASSRGSCLCLTLEGSLNASLIGKASWTAAITINFDDCPSTGTASGVCCIGDGLLTATAKQGKTTNILTMSITGDVCDDPATTEPVAGGGVGDDISVAANFKILPTANAGKFTHSVGTGRFNAFQDAATGDTYVNGNGAIQLVSPF